MYNQVTWKLKGHLPNVLHHYISMESEIIRGEMEASENWRKNLNLMYRQKILRNSWYGLHSYFWINNKFHFNY